MSLRLNTPSLESVQPRSDVAIKGLAEDLYEQLESIGFDSNEIVKLATGLIGAVTSRMTLADPDGDQPSVH